MNLRRELRGKYDKVFEEFDVIIMPTLPMAATKLPERGAPLGEKIQRAFEMIGNTAPFNVTGHPAISVPCGKNSEGLPIGIQIVSKYYNEKTIYKIAYALEQKLDLKL